jgi:phage/plasmid primase-like uncharacterized protein
MPNHFGAQNDFDAASIIAGLGGNTGTGMCLCPAHDDKTPSLKISVGENGKPLWKCFAGCSQDAVLSELRARGLWHQQHSAAEAGDDGHGEAPAPDDIEHDLQRFHRAYKILRAAAKASRSQDIAPATYLENRGITLVPPSALILPKEKAAQYTGRRFSAMVCTIIDDNALLGAHLTFLTLNGAAKIAGDRPRQMFGRAKGGYVVCGVTDAEEPLIVGEGIETTLSAMQLAGLPGIAALSATNLGSPDLTVPACTEVIIGADNDEAGLKAAMKLGERLQAEGRTVRIAKSPLADTDWNDALLDAGDDEGKLTELKRLILEAPSFEELLTPEEKREAQINRLVQIRFDNVLAYEQQRKVVANQLGIRRSVLDEEVIKRAAEMAAKAKASPDPVDVEQLAASAREVIESDDVLDLFARDCAKVIAGESNTLKTLYLVCTSRLFRETTHAAVKGASSGGKSQVRQTVVDHFPPESVINFTALSERALLYMKDDFAHKILSMGEASATDAKAQQFQNYLLRELMSAGKLRYSVPQKIGSDIETVTIEKNGPVVFLVTTTRNALDPENETRMLSLEIDDSAEQTRAVMKKIARSTGLHQQLTPGSYQRWHDYQRWLAAGECRVIVPFAETLSEKIRDAKASRLRRDFKQLLLAIQAHALLHRTHRRKNAEGFIVATVDEDYATVRELMSDVLATGVELKAQAQILTVVAAVKELDEDNEGKGVTVRQLADHMDLGADAVRRWLSRAEYAGYVTNSEEKKGRGHRGRWTCTDESPQEHGDLLPVVEDLKQAHARRIGAPALRDDEDDENDRDRRKSGSRGG